MSQPWKTRYEAWLIISVNWMSWKLVRLLFHQMGRDLPVLGSLVCMQMK